MHGHVVDLGELLVEPLAVGAARIGEVGELPRALAAHDLERLGERQVGKADRVQLAHPRLGEVGLGLAVEDVADEDVARRLVGIDDPRALFGRDADLVQAEDVGLRDAFDLHFGAEHFRDRLADRVFIGVRGSDRAGEREG